MTTWEASKGRKQMEMLCLDDLVPIYGYFLFPPFSAKPDLRSRRKPGSFIV